VQDISTAVNWPCEVKTLFQDGNLGCKGAVSRGINWFFEHESEGVILEDDVLPLPTFFDFCDELLARYRDDHRVGMISGCNLVSNRYSPCESYFFSRYNHIWGWASWRRAWKHYDVAMVEWPAFRDRDGLAHMHGATKPFEAYWERHFDSVYNGKIDTWDYQWTFTCWYKGLLTALPSSNQTHNLGFGADATHTTTDAPEYVKASAAKSLAFPLIHPPTVNHDLKADAAIDSIVFKISRWSEVKHRLFAINSVRKSVQAIKSTLRNAI
jgi:hypothetical protein